MLDRRDGRLGRRDLAMQQRPGEDFLQAGIARRRVERPGDQGTRSKRRRLQPVRPHLGAQLLVPLTGRHRR